MMGNSGIAKLRRCNEEKPICVVKGSVELLVLLIRDSGQTKLEIRNWIESERLVVLAGNVVDSIEEEPRVFVGNGGGENGRRDYGIP